MVNIKYKYARGKLFVRCMGSVYKNKLKEGEMNFLSEKIRTFALRKRILTL